MRTRKCKTMEQQAHTVPQERRELIASLSALVSTHAITDTRLIGSNRIVMNLAGLGDWIYYANTGTCFKACDCVTGDAIHHQLQQDGVHHTFRGSMKVCFAVA